MRINTRRMACVVAVVLAAGSCGRADQPFAPMGIESRVVPVPMSEEDTASARNGVGTLGSGNRDESSTQSSGVGTIGSGN